MVWSHIKDNCSELKDQVQRQTRKVRLDGTKFMRNQQIWHKIIYDNNEISQDEQAAKHLSNLHQILKTMANTNEPYIQPISSLNSHKLYRHEHGPTPPPLSGVTGYERY